MTQLPASMPLSPQSSESTYSPNTLDSVLETITETIASSAETYDRSSTFPAANFDLLHEHGLLALTVPKRLGGAGADLTTTRKVVSAVAKGEPSTALILTMQYLQHFRLQEDLRWPSHLREQLANGAVQKGALINAFRVEPALGTPARGGLPETLAKRTSDGWCLSGTKIYSTGSYGLEWYLVWARSDDADPLIGGFLVHKDAPGIQIIDEWDHLGMRATCSHRVEFKNVLIPLDHAVAVNPASAPKPELDSEGAIWMAVLLSTIYDAVAQSARDWLVKFLRDRVPSNLGQPLASLPRFQEQVGRIDTLLFANRTLLDSAATGLVSAENTGKLKQLVTQNAIKAVELAIEVSGNPGLSRQNALERHYRDVLCSRIHTPQDDVVFISAGRDAFAEVATK